MKVLIADNERYRDFLQDLVKQNQDSQVSGIAVDAEGSTEGSGISGGMASAPDRTKLLIKVKVFEKPCGAKNGTPK